MTHKKIHIRVGTALKLKVDCLGNKAGTYGLCYEVYNIGIPGYSFIFPNKEYCGFSMEGVDDFFDTNSEKFIAKKSNYKFTNGLRLLNDFDKYFKNTLLTLNAK